MFFVEVYPHTKEVCMRTLKAINSLPYVDASGCESINYHGKKKCIYHVVSGVYKKGVRGVRASIVKVLKSLERKYGYRFKFSVLYGTNGTVIYESRRWPYF